MFSEGIERDQKHKMGQRPMLPAYGNQSINLQFENQLTGLYINAAMVLN